MTWYFPLGDNYCRIVLMQTVVARQLYQLQEIDLELDANEQALRRIESQLMDDRAVVEARHKLATTQQHLDEIRKEQHSLEWDIDDLRRKFDVTHEKLYGGRIRNPKELTDLQTENEVLKTKVVRLEDRLLGVMEQGELAAKSVGILSNELKALETEWQGQQHKLRASLEQVKSAIDSLRQKWQLMAAAIAPQIIETYQKLRQQKGKAIVRVEQGICQGCRISLSVNELQGATSGGLVQCSSCGRILFLP